jgi:hypothetical protein
LSLGSHAPIERGVRPCPSIDLRSIDSGRANVRSRA